MRDRETYFECRQAGIPEQKAYVRAWSYAEAEMIFRERLSAEGVTAPGTIVVKAPGRNATDRAEYVSTVGARAASSLCVNSALV